MLISHSNNVDLGIIFPKLCDIAITLKCDVISYDYSGYGCSNDNPNYDSLKNNLITVLDFAINTFDLKKENIVLLSFGIGAISSIYATSKPNYCSLRGMILISPILNFIKKFNYDCINEVICPVFIIQGDIEENINQNETLSFCKQFKESILWISKKGKSHEEIMDENRYKFYQKIRKFLEHVKTTRLKIKQTIVDSINSSIVLK